MENTEFLELFGNFFAKKVKINTAIFFYLKPTDWRT